MFFVSKSNLLDVHFTKRQLALVPCGGRRTSLHIITKTRLFKYTLKILPTKNENFRIKILIFFHTSAQNIDCRYSLEPPQRGGSNEDPQSMFLSRNKKNNVYPCKPQFYYIKVGLRGSKSYRYVFVMLMQIIFHFL